MCRSISRTKNAYAYAPINSKLQHPPPQAYPGHLTVYRARGGGGI